MNTRASWHGIRTKQTFRRQGFTLVELLVVIVVIAILASVTVVAFNGVQQRARDAQRDSAVAAIKRGLELYKVDNGGYPTPCANVNADCQVASLASYLSPYMVTMPVPPKLASSSYVDMFFNNGGTSTYSMLVLYESKPSCITGVNPMSSYHPYGVTYPLCSN